jgi:hypothetical protein
MENLVSRPCTALDGRGTVTTVTLNGVACIPCIMVCAIPFVLVFLIVQRLFGHDVDQDGDRRSINIFLEGMGILCLLVILCWIASCIVSCVGSCIGLCIACCLAQSAHTTQDFSIRKNQARCNVLLDAALPQRKKTTFPLPGASAPTTFATYGATYSEDYNGNIDEDPIQMNLQLQFIPIDNSSPNGHSWPSLTNLWIISGSGHDGRGCFTVKEGFLNVATKQAYWVTRHRKVNLLTRGSFVVLPNDSTQPPLLAFQGDWLTSGMRQGTITKFSREGWSTTSSF